MRLEKGNRRLQLELKSTSEQQGIQNRQVFVTFFPLFPIFLFFSYITIFVTSRERLCCILEKRLLLLFLDQEHDIVAHNNTNTFLDRALDLRNISDSNAALHLFILITLFPCQESAAERILLLLIRDTYNN